MKYSLCVFVCVSVCVLGDHLFAQGVFFFLCLGATLISVAQKP